MILRRATQAAGLSRTSRVEGRRPTDVVGLCQRQKPARMLELLLTLVTTIAFLAAAFPFRVNLFEVAFFANAIAIVLIYSSACSRWFQGAAS